MWIIANIELKWGNPLGMLEDWLTNKKKISNIATHIGPALAGVLTELPDIGQRYTRNLLDSKVICMAEFKSIGVKQLQQKRDDHPYRGATVEPSQDYDELSSG